MWDLTIIRSWGSRVTRHLSWCVATFSVVIFANFLITVTPVYAIDASWKNGALNYDAKTFTSVGEAVDNDPRKFAKGSKLYAYVENPGSSTQKIHYLVFAPDANLTEATTASYQSFSNPPATSTYTDPSIAQTVTVPKATNASDQPQTTNSAPSSPNDALPAGERTSCDSKFTFGIGWIVCPITNWFANSMDWLFGRLASFLVVRPVTFSTDSALYRAWSIMKNFANLAFVIAFLIIIYSQITSIGYSSYSLKKTLPRLVIAAILVNISYHICALAVDLSNVSGYAVHDLFESMRQSLVGPNGNNWDVVNWKSVAGVVLSGGGAMVGLHILATSGGGEILMLLPILVGAILAVVVALIIMIARQAIITIFIIISPLAFVAYVLPGTEKYFDRWKNVFLTMLLMFPIFAVVFGGAQVAGMAIIQNADSLMLIIFGLAVQVAPVVITPLLIKFSGNLLGKIANIVNNPSRGIVDRTRNWSRERADAHKSRVLAGKGGNNMLYRRARTIDHNRRKREGWKSAHDTMAGQRFEGSSDGRLIDRSNRDTGEDKKLLQAQLDRAHNERINTDRRYIQRDIQTRSTADRGEIAKQLADAKYAEAKTGEFAYNTARTPELDTLMRDIQEGSRETALVGMRKSSAERRQNIDRAQELVDNTLTMDGKLIREYAAGVMGAQGELSVLGQAKSTASESLIKDIKLIEDTMPYDISTDVDELMRRFKSTQTMSERIAYMNVLSKRGAPGHEKLVEAMRHVDGMYQNGNLSTEDLMDFKELTAMNSGIMSGAKDFEFWLTNSKDKVTGQLRTLDQISNDSSTWSNLSVAALANMNIVAQFRALDFLQINEPARYAAYIKAAKTDPARGNIKLAVREKHGIVD